MENAIALSLWVLVVVGFVALFKMARELQKTASHVSFLLDAIKEADERYWELRSGLDALGLRRELPQSAKSARWVVKP